MNLRSLKGTGRWAAVSASVMALVLWHQQLVKAAPKVPATPLVLLQPDSSLVNKVLVNYSPRLLTIGVIAITAYCAVLVSQRIFGLVDRGRLSIPGFPAAWAKPTAFLLNTLLITIAVAASLPYLPWLSGVIAPALAAQGLALFLGLLLALGAITLMSNIVGGMTLMFSRALVIDERVTIGDVTGDVIGQTLLVTRLRTLQNRVVAIPNSLVLASRIEHLTDARWIDTAQPRLVQTTLNISYRFPWRKVHTVLIQAARQTESVIEIPSPFVVQKSLGDACVRYELNAYTDQPGDLDLIQSELHQHIQDGCNEAGIELIAPQYAALRDGNDPAMPEDYFSIKDIKPGARAGFSRQWFGALTAHQESDEDAHGVAPEFEAEDSADGDWSDEDCADDEFVNATIAIADMDEDFADDALSAEDEIDAGDELELEADKVYAHTADHDALEADNVVTEHDLADLDVADDRVLVAVDG